MIGGLLLNDTPKTTLKLHKVLPIQSLQFLGLFQNSLCNLELLWNECKYVNK